MTYVCMYNMKFLEITNLHCSMASELLLSNRNEEKSITGNVAVIIHETIQQENLIYFGLSNANTNINKNVRIPNWEIFQKGLKQHV